MSDKEKVVSLCESERQPVFCYNKLELSLYQ